MMLPGLLLLQSLSILGSTLILTDTAYALPILFQYCSFIIEKMAPKAVCSCPPVIFQDCHCLQMIWIDTERSLAEMIQDQTIRYRTSVMFISPPVNRDGSCIQLEDSTAVCANFALPYPTPIFIFGDSLLKPGNGIMGSQHV